MSQDPRYDAAALRGFASDLFAREGVAPDKAAVMAEVLVEADLLGHVTHGLALAPKYIEDIPTGILRTDGEPEVLSDRGACLAWNGRGLPGAWLVMKALETAFDRVGQYGTVSIAIGESHHIGCLAVYPLRAAERGLMAILHSSAPGNSGVAPFGGRQGVLAPDPVSAAWPTGEEPVVLDISASITTMNLSQRMAREGAKFEHDWLLDAEGNPSRDPAVLNRGGTILPTGGLDHGQKGYAQALMTEALTQGLSGRGRVEGTAGMRAALFLQVIDPGAFAGLDAFTRQTGHTAAACRAAAPRPGMPPVRVPGQKGLALKRQALAEGVPLAERISGPLAELGARHGLALPQPVGR
ncbi:Ldh family oxidoreductase [Roseomonas marmotae]|uniref:Ldh family oxidoreductase n=1 Tax=Roseomonas marmotae TaxID=2768161 RepID=A0ABS3K6R5_9PROT|nr:Ldh family oxidoreductase [Roseomonas marmotae]MBO1073147.1 Ldh family oxidoreductase [Roseomonas marmotae]QTI79217.1 Ldh family oxidoreductase [Roseomonas marmotae]